MFCLFRFHISKQIVEEDGQSFTPLVIAARNGRYKVVKTILNNFKPNIEQECVVKFDGHIVHGATALWCAAGSGHLNVIKLLIQYGANVNHKTKTHSTPLRAACFDGKYFGASARQWNCRFAIHPHDLSIQEWLCSFVNLDNDFFSKKKQRQTNNGTVK